MALIPSLSWTSPGTPDYITRQEVIDFASSVVAYISAGGLSTINVNVGPNPSFSTININPTGNIGMNGSLITNAQSYGISSIGQLAIKPLTTVQNVMSFVNEPGVNNQDVQSRSLTTRDNPNTSAAPGVRLDKTGLSGATNDSWGGFYTPGITWLGSNGANLWALQNISSLNGQNPNTSPTSFTTLTGTTLNAQFVNTNSINNISSINGLPKIAIFDSTYNIAGIGSLADNTPTVVGTITAPYTFPTNCSVAATVNVRVGAFAPGSPAVAYLQFGLRIGGQGAGGGIFYTNAVAVPTALTGGFTNISISGIYPTPTASSTNTIEIVVVSITGTSLTCQITNPTSPANIVVAQVLS